MAEKTFDNLDPPVSVTNPGGAPAGVAFPRHVHADDGSYVEAVDEADLAAKLKEGYTLEPQCNLDGSPFAKDVKKGLPKKIVAAKA
jgi:hypothetical protein